MHINKSLYDITTNDLPQKVGVLYWCPTPLVKDGKRARYRLEDTIVEIPYTHYFYGTINDYNGRRLDHDVELVATVHFVSNDRICKSLTPIVEALNENTWFKKTPSEAARVVFENLEGNIRAWQRDIDWIQKKIDSRRAFIDLVKSKSIYT